MAAVPKQKPPKSATNSNRSAKKAWALKHQFVTPVRCPNCGAPRANHRVCKNCGQYNGRIVVETKAKVRRVSKTT